MWLLYIVWGVVIFIVGYVVAFFIMKNNPKYFNIDKMAKEELTKLQAKIKEKI